jgi:HEAT repeat protein
MRLWLILLLAPTALQDAEIDHLIRTLDSDKVEEREQAERQLTSIGLRARPALQRAAADARPEKAARGRGILRAPVFRMEELFEAGFHRETAATIPNFPKRFCSALSSDRSAAVRDLAGQASPEDLRALAAILGREDLSGEIRLACVDLMEKVKRPELTPLVVPLLDPRTSTAVGRVLLILAAADAKEAAPAIEPLLDNASFVQPAIAALEKLRCPVPDEVLRRMLRSREDAVRRPAVAIVEKGEGVGFAPDLIELLRNGYEPSWTMPQTLARSRPSWTELRPLLEAGKPAARLLALKVAAAMRLPEALDAALALLDDTDEDTRRQAMEFVVGLKGEETVRRLSAKGGPNALIALARLRARGPDAAAAAALSSRDPWTRRAGIAALRALDSHDFAAALVPLLEDAAPEVRAEAARVLPHLAGDGVGPRLAARLAHEDDPRVQERLVDAVAETGCREAAPQILKLLKDPRPQVVAAAVRAAGALEMKEAAPLLVQEYVSRKPEHPRGAYEALLQIRPDNLTTLLKPYLVPRKREDEEKPGFGHRFNIRPDDEPWETALYLLYVDPPGGKELFLQCLKDGMVPQYPVELIRFFGAEEAFPWLISALEKGTGRELHGAGRLLASYGRRDLVGFMMERFNGIEHNNAFEFLGGIQARERIPDFEARLDDPDEKIRDAAWRVLQWMGGPKVQQIFRRRLREGTPMDRAYAAHFLVSPDAEDLRLIDSLLDSANAEVRAEGVYALYLRHSKESFDHVVRAYERGTQASDWVWPFALTTLGGARGRAMVRSMIAGEKNPEKVRSLFGAMGQGEGFVAADVQLIEHFLGDPEHLKDTQFATDAMKALMRIDPERAMALLSEPRFRLSMPQGNWGVAELEYVKTPAGVRALTTFLLDREPQNRGQAASMLGKRGAVEAREPLAKLLHDEEAGCRGSAAIALARLGDARGLDEIFRLRRRTTVNQGRMHDALWALNFIRQPEATRQLASVHWEYEGPSHWTLQEALEELGRRSGLRVVLSPSLSARGLRTPPDWHVSTAGAEEVLSETSWSRFAAIVVEPGEIRVLPPDEALAFWEKWARTR